MSLKKKLDKIKIIAEIGVNHNGNINIAKKLIIIAKECGADYAKFQIYDTKYMITDYVKKTKYQSQSLGLSISQKKMLEKYQLTISQIKSLYIYCKKIGIKFCASIFDEKSLGVLKKLKIDFVKLPSSEITNYFLIKKLSEIKNMPIIFSTGMASNLEIDQTYKILKRNRSIVIPMYCVSSYPTKLSEINFKRLIYLKKKYKKIGISDHTKTHETSILSVNYGIKFIEKHLTFNNSAKGPDHLASLNPENFKNFVDSIRNTEILLENRNIKNYEKKNMKYVRKYLVAKKNIFKGDKFTEKNITCKRSGGGINPFYFNKIKNKTAKKNFKINEIIVI